MIIRTVLAVFLVAAPALAGDFCVVVCDGGKTARRTCPGPTMRTSNEMAADLRLYAQGGKPGWPIPALINGMFSFCSAAERRAVAAAAIKTMDAANAERRRQLADFVCMIDSDSCGLRPLRLPWTAASAAVDADGDGRADRIRILSRDATRHVDEEPCATCGDQVRGHFVALVTLSSTKRTVETPVTLHPGVVDTMWFWNGKEGALAVADYNGDGRPDFNLGQFTNSNKWEYKLFTLREDGRVEMLASPEIYVAPGGKPSTPDIEVVAGGIRFKDFGNAGESPGWWIFSCRWNGTAFECSGEPQR